MFDRYHYQCLIDRISQSHPLQTATHVVTFLAIMVKLTTDVVEKKYSQILSSKSLSKTIKKEELWKLTHLYMNDMFINSIVSYIFQLYNLCI